MTHEHRFERTPDGTVWTQVTGSYSFWERYLGVFDCVKVLARVHDVREVPYGFHRADGENVIFVSLPYYIGPWQYLYRAKKVNKTARAAIEKNDAVILRIPGQIGFCIEPYFRATGHPYAVEVVGDPHDVFSPGAVRHPLRPLFRWWFPRIMRRHCAGACAAAYVTQFTLQRRYPCTMYSIGISDVELSTMHFAHAKESINCPPGDKLSCHTFDSKKRRELRKEQDFTIITVGSLSQMYKATDVLIDAAAACFRKGLDLRLMIIGDGKHRLELEARAWTSGLGERVHFLGQFPFGSEITAQLDEADLFVLPSRTEGLPRAMIEAMARGLPCIGSTAGGIPELLPQEDLVPPGDIPALTRKIMEVSSSQERMAKMSRRNLEKALEFRNDILQKRRVDYYRYVRKTMEEWLGEDKSS